MAASRMRVGIATSLLYLCWSMNGSGLASAVGIDFESPSYSAGTIIGQNGWGTAVSNAGRNGFGARGCAQNTILNDNGVLV